MSCARRLVPLLAMLVALAAAPIAAAHAFLVRSEPPPGSSVASAPAHIRLVFDEPVAHVQVVVTRADGSPVGSGRPRAGAGHRREIVVSLPQRLARGGYVVRWSEIDEDDGHHVSGAFSFGVGTAPPAVQAGGGSSFQPGDAVARWLLLVGLLVAGGVVVFRRAVWRTPDRVFVLAAAGALAMAAAGAGILLALQPGTVATRFDRITLAGAIGAATAAAAGLASVRLPRLRIVADAGAVALLALPTLDGHASAAGLSHLLSIPSDLVHVAGASIWIGGVFSVVLLVPSARRGEAIRRFAPIALVAVTALGVTGILRAIGELKSVSQLWAVSYGQAILVKTGLFVSVIAFAARARGRPDRRGLVVEAVLLSGLLVVVAVLLGLRPGRDIRAAPAAPLPPAFVTAAEAGPYAVGVELAPASDGVRAQATVLGVQGPASGLRVTVAIAGSVAETRPCGAGCYAATVPVSRPGSLSIRVERRPAVSTASLRVPARWPPPPASAIVDRAARAFRALRTLTIRSRLASTPTVRTTTVWKMQAPNRLSGFELGTGLGTVLIGDRRWDRDSAGARWVESPQVPLRQPTPSWPARVRAAHVLGSGVVDGRSVWVVSFFDPATPAWFTIDVDQKTARTYSMDMIAAAHFMHEDYRDFNAPLVIRPPR